MKFDVSQIARDYVQTLVGERITLVSVIDLSIAFGLPILAAIASFWFSSNVDSNLYLSLFTLLGVFVAVFIAIFSVLIPLFHSPRKVSKDIEVDKRYKNENDIRKKVIAELSTSLSYLMLFSIISMAFLTIPIATKSNLFLFKWIAVFIGSHMLLNLLIVMKRLHALFRYEFRLK